MGAGDEGSQVIQRRNAGPLGVIGISGVALEVPLTGGRTEGKVGSGVVSRWSEMPPVGRPA